MRLGGKLKLTNKSRNRNRVEIRMFKHDPVHSARQQLVSAAADESRP
jgi:hypothetical protein